MRPSRGEVRNDCVHTTLTFSLPLHSSQISQSRNERSTFKEDFMHVPPTLISGRYRLRQCFRRSSTSQTNFWSIQKAILSTVDA